MKWHKVETYLYRCVYTAGLESVGHMTGKLLTTNHNFCIINVHIK